MNVHIWRLDLEADKKAQIDSFWQRMFHIYTLVLFGLQFPAEGKRGIFKLPLPTNFSKFIINASNREYAMILFQIYLVTSNMSIILIVNLK